MSMTPSADITGYSRDEVLGQNPRILKSGRQEKEFYAADVARSDEKRPLVR